MATDPGDKTEDDLDVNQHGAAATASLLNNTPQASSHNMQGRTSFKSSIFGKFEGSHPTDGCKNGENRPNNFEMNDGCNHPVQSSNEFVNTVVVRSPKFATSIGYHKKKLKVPKTVQSLLNEQKYLELLELNDATGALSVLRNQLALSEIDPTKLEYLSSLIMCLGVPGGFIQNPTKYVSSTSSRNALLKNLKDFIPSVAVIPPDRLKVLINQAFNYQISNCIYHCDLADQRVGLYADHVCSRASFPTTTCCILKYHTDEVWFVSFSHNDLYLASASKDKTAIVWSIERMDMLYLLSGHTEPVSSVAWSHDDTKLLTISNDNTLKLWEMKSGTCITTFRVHTANVTSCVWLPSDEKFVSGSVDKNMCLCSIDGSLIHVWNGIRANDMTVTRDGKTLIVASERYIRLYDLRDKSMIGLVAESDFITSINMSAHTGYALINLLGEAIHLWDLESRSMVRRYTGPSKKRFIIRSCFGGSNDRYVLSGSEDSKIYVWHREKGVLIEVLPGHTGVVNCVNWCSSKSIFASASDDRTIRIWGNKPNALYNGYIHTGDETRDGG